jgi:hypothetical protein
LQGLFHVRFDFTPDHRAQIKRCPLVLCE